VCCKTAGFEMVTDISFGTEEHYLKPIRFEAFEVSKCDKIM
jgi:hypothetical protein